LRFQRQLQGRDGLRIVAKDRLGHVVEELADQTDAINGDDVQLSLDSKIQFFAYQRIRDVVREHHAKAGSVVVLDTQSGEILALANYPSFSPGNERLGPKDERRRNRALTDFFEPGSTMKPFTIALALDSGRVTPQTAFDTAPGRITIGGRTINDAHPHGVLTVAEIVQKSSNVGTVKMAMQMQPREMWDLFSQVGFGQRPQIDFPGAVTGRLRPYKTWRPVEQATMSYGYGLSATPLQLARAYTVFARDGEVIPVTMMKQAEPVNGVRVLKPETAQIGRAHV
jgi:cell division protein FtsI (penicillin-binding protein 3)